MLKNKSLLCISQSNLSKPFHLTLRLFLSLVNERQKQTESEMKGLMCISYSTCPTVYVNKHLSSLTYGRVPTKGRNYFGTRNLRISISHGFDTHVGLHTTLLLVLQSSKIALFIGTEFYRKSE